MTNETKSPSWFTLGGGLLKVALGAAGGWLLYSRFGVPEQAPLPDAIPSRRQLFFSETAGQLNYYFDTGGEGRPLLLIHSINAAASAYEMRPLFQHYQGQRPVYALDLPGFGLSERSKRKYTPQLYTAAVIDMIEKQIGEPADIVALSLGSEFAASAALTRPDLVHSLALISPSGLQNQGGHISNGIMPEKSGQWLLHKFLSFPLWGKALFDLIATRRSIVYFLKQSFVGEAPLDLVAYDYATAHQPGAEHAPLTFISGLLFTEGAYGRLYKPLTTPSLILYDQDNFVSFDALPALLKENPVWRAHRIRPTLGLPQFEKLSETTAALNEFWRSLANNDAGATI